MEEEGRSRWPSVLVVVLAIVVLLTSASSRGMAVSSPDEAALRPALAVKAPRPMVIIEDDPVPAGPSGPVKESEPVSDEYFDDVAFLGDSRTEGFYLYSGLRHGMYYYAVGATVESVFTKKVWVMPEGKIPLLDAVAQAELGKVYIMFGVNELGWTKTDDFKDQYRKVIERLREDHPEVQIVLQSILPVSAKQEEKKTYVNNERIAVYNDVIEALAAETGCYFVNVAEVLTGPDGCLPADLNFVGIHLNPEGCRIWLHYLRTHAVG